MGQLHPEQRRTVKQPQDFDISAAAIDFFVTGGRSLDRAETFGAAQITIAPAQSSLAAGRLEARERTVVTAGHFDARFVAIANGPSRLTSVHGGPDAKIVNSAAGSPDRVSASQTVDATFPSPGGDCLDLPAGEASYTATISRPKSECRPGRSKRLTRRPMEFWF